MYKGIFGTRCEATICVKVQLSDTQISIGKRQGLFFKEPSLSEKKSKLRVQGTKRGRKELRGKRKRSEDRSNKEEKEAKE